MAFAKNAPIRFKHALQMACGIGRALLGGVDVRQRGERAQRFAVFFAKRAFRTRRCLLAKRGRFCGLPQASEPHDLKVEAGDLVFAEYNHVPCAQLIRDLHLRLEAAACVVHIRRDAAPAQVEYDLHRRLVTCIAESRYKHCTAFITRRFNTHRIEREHEPV